MEFHSLVGYRVPFRRAVVFFKLYIPRRDGRGRGGGGGGG